ncbi:MAG: sigma 54-interacting transcriptional regulator, partial [Rhizobiales bacterium]|nr:sigma 54-interacting transcriptional regulator [Hyphomicrobiales bacterium]
MSGHASVRHVHALGLVRLAVEQIEHRLFERGFDGARVLRFQSEAELIGTASEAILVFEADRLVAANRRALKLLKLDWDALGQVPLEELFEAIAPGDAVREIRTQTGETLLGRFDTEAAPVRPPSRRRTLAAGEIEPFFDAATTAALRRTVRLVAADVPVLIHGETGAGKEVFARRAHVEGSRSSGPFVAVNCAALPENLIESELFGYEE